MTLRPELTFNRAVSAMVRWSWLILIIAVCVAVAARAVAGQRSHTSYSASVQVHLQQIQLDNTRGFPTADRLTPKTFPDGSVFLDAAAAKAAADVLKTVTAGELLAGIDATGVDVDTALLTYSARTRDAAARNLGAYASAFVEQRRSQQTSELTNAMPEEVQSYRANGTVRTDIGALASRANLAAAIAGVSDRVRRGEVQIEQQPGSLSPNAATLTGLLAGLAMGVLLALALNRFDPRVRRESELARPGVKVFSTTPGGRASLRVDLELTALGTDGGVIALTDVDGGGAEDAALDLARAFVAAGTSAVVLDTTVDPSAGGIRSFMEGSSTSLPVSEIAPDLRWVGGGASDVDDASLFTAGRVRELLEEARKSAQVVLISAGALDDDASALLTVGLADGAVLLAARGTRWSALEAVVDRFTSVARTPVRIWFGQHPHGPRVAAGEPRVEASVTSTRS
jgi:hypothetical protein